MEEIHFTSTDQVELVGDLLAPAQPKVGVLLLHMMPADRTSWHLFQERLSSVAIASLAIDLRGHGASTHQAGRSIDYHLFSDEDHQNSRLDVQAAIALLQARFGGVTTWGVAGASIGANLALWALSQQPNLAWAVALSAGLDYHGLKTGDLPSKWRAEQAVYLAASKEDSEAAEALKFFHNESTQAQLTTQLLEDVGHGTAMWERQPALMDAILSWITER